MPKKYVVDKKAKEVKKSKGRGKAFINYFKNIISELKKVAWPTREETMRFTWVVIVFIIICVIIIGAFDYGLMTLLEQLVDLKAA